MTPLIGAFEGNAETVVIGSVIGLTYAMLGAGLVLVFRSSRVLNFAHAQLGALGAAVMMYLVSELHWPFLVGLPVAIAFGAGVAALVEIGVVRRFEGRPRIPLLVATIGLSQILFLIQLVMPEAKAGTLYPTPIHGAWTVLGVQIQGGHIMVLIVAPLVIGGLFLILDRTTLGVAIRGAADNPDAARLVGVSPRTVSLAVWSMAGAVAVISVVFANPVRGGGVGILGAFGPGLLIRALVAALAGRMVSLPATIVGGVALGATEALLQVNVDQPGTIDFILFVVVLVLLLARGAEGGETESWMPSRRAAALSPGALGTLNRVRRIIPRSALVIAVALPFVFDSSDRLFLFSRVALFALIGLSVVIVTAWSGQLSLAQFALVGVGSFVTSGLVSHGMPFGAAVFYAAVSGAVAAEIIGGPALRLKGLFLTVTTLAFAIGAEGWLFRRSIFFEPGSTIGFVPRASLGPIDLADARSYYFLCLLALLACYLMLRQVERGGIYRRFIAVRENEDAASSATISPATTKLIAFALSGGVAAFAGGLLAGLRVQFEPSAYADTESIRVLTMTIIGGLGSLSGAVIGALYMLGIPALLGDSLEIQLLTSGVGLLIILLVRPAGLLDVGEGLLVRIARHRHGSAAGDDREDPSTLDDSGDVDVDSAARTALDRSWRSEDLVLSTSTNEGEIPLQCTRVCVTFGGLVADRDVNLRVDPGEIVGLIGTNGAGKSTLMNAISGLVPVASGTVTLFGQDVTREPAHERARRGMGRVFQDARLFGALTVEQTIMVALEAAEPTELVPATLNLPPARCAERHKRSRAGEVIDLLGLGRYAHAPISSLSTGTKRIVELASLIVQQSDLLLLDEPTAGVAQREVEAFGPLIARLRDELGASILLIEHDLPLVMSLSNRVYCMSAGEVIADGLPDSVRNDPKVIAAYLGTDERAIARSDSGKPS